ncbi:MAG: hypothetical protein LBL43_06090 [Treponema sp.]|jgi:hypothetical protein|nr:hypothetical protein [Treponema sp.]
MAIQPIDLQTLFTQMDKVGKAQAAQREGAQLQASLQGLENQRKAEERVQSVNEAQNTGDGAEGINDNTDRGGSGEKPGRKRKGQGEAGKEEDDPKEKHAEIIRDPALGRNIDFSG